MKNICTFETARALKEAGFPQPEPEAGQVWYSSGVEFLIGGVSKGNLAAFALSLLDVQGYWVLDFDRFVEDAAFAPTAADILRQLPEMRLYFYAGRWYLEDVEDEFVLQQLSDESDTEVCAAAWLARDKKAVEK